MPVKHPIASIRAGLTHEIARRGTMESFMIRAGLLADLLDELTAYREAPASLPALDEGLVIAAMKGHYGKAGINIDGIDLTVNDYNWTFRQGFQRMWAGVRSELKRRTASAMFEPDEAREGAGRSSIKKSLRAEGRNFID